METRLPPCEARCRWVGAEGHSRQQRPFVTRPAPADREPCPSFLHRSPAPHHPRHGTALSCHETSLTWSPLQPSVETLLYWDLQLVSHADERRSRVDEDVDQVRARSRPFGLGSREGGAGEPSPVEASGAVLPNACPVRACAGPCDPCENRRLHPFSPRARSVITTSLAQCSCIPNSSRWSCIPKSSRAPCAPSLP